MVEIYGFRQQVLPGFSRHKDKAPDRSLEILIREDLEETPKFHGKRTGKYGSDPTLTCGACSVEFFGTSPDLSIPSSSPVVESSVAAISIVPPSSRIFSAVPTPPQANQARNHAAPS